MLWLIWLVALSSALLLYLRQAYSRFSKCGVKYFRPVPLLGNTAKTLFRLEHTVESIENLYKAFPDERFVGTYEFVRPIIVIRDLDLIKKVTVKDFEYFHDHRGFLDEDFEPLFSRNLFALQGQKWKDMRSTLSPAFTSSKIRLMVPFMEEAVNLMTYSIKKEMQNSNAEHVKVDCKDMLSRYANDVIATCAFGLKVDSHVEKENQFFVMGRETTRFTGYKMLKFFAYLAFPNLIKKLKIKLFDDDSSEFFRNLVMGTMEERKNRNIIRNDMIHLLMEAKKGRLVFDEKVANDTDAGFATVEESDIGKKVVTREWSDDDLIAQAVLFFIAGFETVSVAMTFLLFELAANPDVQEKLRKEILDNHQKNNGKFDYRCIQQMVYMDMVVSESLRKWPPAVATDRLCKKDYNLGKPNENSCEDYIIREGEGIIVPTWAIHRSPEYYPNPEKFDPERFSEENKHKINPFSYMPFGVGPRNCIGSRFALCEVKVMLYNLLLNLEVMPCEKTCLPIQLSTKSFNFMIKGGHWLKFKARNGVSN